MCGGGAGRHAQDLLDAVPRRLEVALVKGGHGVGEVGADVVQGELEDGALGAT